MQFNRKTVTTLFMVALIALAGIGAFAGGASAATDTLAGDGNDQVTGFEANESNSIETSIAADGTDFSTDGSTQLKMNVSYDGETYAVTSEDVADGTSASQTINLSNDELADLPGDAGANTTVEVTTWGVNADGNVTTAASSFDVDITFDSSYAVASVNDDTATIEDVEVGFLASSLDSAMFWSSSSDEPVDLHTYESTVGIDGSNTTVTVYDETENGSDAYSEAFREGIESGDVIYGASVGVDGTPVKAFYDSADSEKLSDGDTYAVYDSTDNVWTVHTGDAQDGASEMDVYISSQDYTSVDSFDASSLNDLFIGDLDMGVFSLTSNFGFGSLTTFSILEAVGIGMVVPAGGLSLAFLIPAGRKRFGA